MTKTLTEQWKDGTLEQKYYYVQFNGNPKPFVEIELKNFLLDLVKVKDRDTIEVLAPVPSYDHFSQMVKKVEQLQEQLKIATKALKKIERIKVGKENNFSILIAHSYSREAIKEMEGVK